MAELKLGTKHDCFSCGTKFYDFGKPHPICPRCGADQKQKESHKKSAPVEIADVEELATEAEDLEIDDEKELPELDEDELTVVVEEAVDTEVAEDADDDFEEVDDDEDGDDDFDDDFDDD